MKKDSCDGKTYHVTGLYYREDPNATGGKLYLYDDDADGDGIRNEMERAASTGLNLFDPFSAESTPSDVDFDID